MITTIKTLYKWKENWIGRVNSSGNLWLWPVTCVQLGITPKWKFWISSRMLRFESFCHKIQETCRNYNLNSSVCSLWKPFFHDAMHNNAKKKLRDFVHICTSSFVKYRIIHYPLLITRISVNTQIIFFTKHQKRILLFFCQTCRHS